MEFLMVNLGITGIIFLCIVSFVIYILPGVIAYKRDHHYKWVIIAMNLFFGATAIGWLVALVWAVWPRETPVVSIVVDDIVSGNKH